MRIWLWEYAFWVMGICILVMLGYGHDESAPTPDGVFCGVSWVDITLLVNRLQRIGYLYVTFSQNKRVVFALQKYGFWRAKRGFLMDKNRVLHF